MANPNPTRKGKAITRDLAADREVEVMNLRMARMSYAEIARRLDLNQQTVGVIVRRVLERRAREQEFDKDKMIAEQQVTIDRLIQARLTDAVRQVRMPVRSDFQDEEVYARAASAAAAERANVIKATDVINKLLQREAKLWGLDAPVQHQVQVTDAWQTEIDELMGQIKAMDEAKARARKARERG